VIARALVFGGGMPPDQVMAMTIDDLAWWYGQLVMWRKEQHRPHG
jgi:hypothetical protein